MLLTNLFCIKDMSMILLCIPTKMMNATTYTIPFTKCTIISTQRFLRLIIYVTIFFKHGLLITLCHRAGRICTNDIIGEGWKLLNQIFTKNGYQSGPFMDRIVCCGQLACNWQRTAHGTARWKHARCSQTCHSGVIKVKHYFRLVAGNTLYYSIRKMVSFWNRIPLSLIKDRHAQFDQLLVIYGY